MKLFLRSQLIVFLVFCMNVQTLRPPYAQDTEPRTGAFLSEKKESLLNHEALATIGLSNRKDILKTRHFFWRLFHQNQQQSRETDILMTTPRQLSDRELLDPSLLPHAAVEKKSLESPPFVHALQRITENPERFLNTYDRLSKLNYATQRNLKNTFTLFPMDLVSLFELAHPHLNDLSTYMNDDGYLELSTFLIAHPAVFIVDEPLAAFIGLPLATTHSETQQTLYVKFGGDYFNIQSKTLFIPEHLRNRLTPASRDFKAAQELNKMNSSYQLCFTMAILCAVLKQEPDRTPLESRSPITEPEVKNKVATQAARLSLLLQRISLSFPWSTFLTLFAVGFAIDPTSLASLGVLVTPPNNPPSNKASETDHLDLFNRLGEEGQPAPAKILPPSSLPLFLKIKIRHNAFASFQDISEALLDEDETPQQVKSLIAQWRTALAAALAQPKPVMGRTSPPPNVKYYSSARPMVQNTPLIVQTDQKTSNISDPKEKRAKRPAFNEERFKNALKSYKTLLQRFPKKNHPLGEQLTSKGVLSRSELNSLVTYIRNIMGFSRGRKQRMTPPSVTLQTGVLLKPADLWQFITNSLEVRVLLDRNDLSTYDLRRHIDAHRPDIQNDNNSLGQLLLDLANRQFLKRAEGKGIRYGWKYQPPVLLHEPIPILTFEEARLQFLKTADASQLQKFYGHNKIADAQNLRRILNLCWAQAGSFANLDQLQPALSRHMALPTARQLVKQFRKVLAAPDTLAAAQTPAPSRHHPNYYREHALRTTFDELKKRSALDTVAIVDALSEIIPPLTTTRKRLTDFWNRVITHIPSEDISTIETFFKSEGADALIKAQLKKRKDLRANTIRGLTKPLPPAEAATVRVFIKEFLETAEPGAGLQSLPASALLFKRLQFENFMAGVDGAISETKLRNLEKAIRTRLAYKLKRAS